MGCFLEVAWVVDKGVGVMGGGGSGVILGILNAVVVVAASMLAGLVWGNYLTPSHPSLFWIGVGIIWGVVIQVVLKDPE